MNKGKLFLIAGPSGVGKKTLISEILKEKNLNLMVSVSFTTRNKRPGERDGIDYFFIDKEEFKKKIANGEMLEHAEFFNNFYGTSKEWVESKLNEGINVLLEIETEGFKQIQEKFPELISIFILPSSMDELANRLRKRGTENEEDIQMRIKKAKEEVKVAHLFNHRIINNTISVAAKELKEAIENEL